MGVELGLPRCGVSSPVSGAGLGVRILGEVKKEYADVFVGPTISLLKSLQRLWLYDQSSQAFAVFLPVKSVGVVGDARRYAHVIALRAVETDRFYDRARGRIAL